ncbi:MAG: hypothetical protein RIB46_09610 [Pseudomonadales bacterium]
MRTTLTIDDDLLAALKERAFQEGVPLKQMVNQTLRRGLDAQTRPTRRKPYRAATFALGQPLLPSLDKSLAIASALEDEEIARKLQLRK